MKFEGRVYKSKSFWLAEIPALDLMTQGKTRKEALVMIKDALELLVNERGFSVDVLEQEKNIFHIVSQDTKPLLALMLHRQRLKHNLSLSQMAQKLGLKSKNAYAQYEQARSEPSLSQLQKLLSAMNENISLVVTMA